MTDQDGKKQNITLIIGLAIPVAMILFIAIAINGPRWFNTVDAPKFDLLYTTGQPNPYRSFSVVDGILVVHEPPVTDAGGSINSAQDTLHFFLHDVSENSSREIQLDEAMQLSLDGSSRSPDGFTVVNSRRRGWFFFGYSRSNNNRYLVKDNYSHKIDLEAGAQNYNYYWNFQMLGWVISDE